MNVLITLTSAGTDTGPFNLYSNVDNYTTAFETNISKEILVAGYTSTIVPPGTSAIRVKSMGTCNNYINIVLTVPSTTTSTTTRAVTTTTSTTAQPITPTTTTTSTTTTIFVPTTTTTTTPYVGPSTTSTTSTTSTSTTGIPIITTTTTTTTVPIVTTTTTTSLPYSSFTIYANVSSGTNPLQGWESSTSACGAIGTSVTIYVNQPGINSIADAVSAGKALYLNTNFISGNLYNGGNTWFKTQSSLNGYYFQLGTQGEISNYASCGGSETTTTTTTGIPTTTTTTTTPDVPTTTTTTTAEVIITTTSTTTTAVLFYSVILNSTSGLSNGTEACSDYSQSNRKRYYMSSSNGPNINNGTFLYTDSSLTNFIPNGYYSNGSTYWFFQNGNTGDNGNPCTSVTTTTFFFNNVTITEPDKPQYFFSNNQPPSYYDDKNNLPVIFTNQPHYDPVNDLVWITNDTIKIGINLKRGGQLAWASLIDANTNLVYNGYDGGFQVTLDAYQKKDGYTQDGEVAGSGIPGSPSFSYNVTQGGDFLNHAVTLIDYHAVPNGYYVKLRPIHYPLSAKLSETFIEATYTITGRTVKIDYRYTSFRTDGQWDGGGFDGAGAPACFIVNTLNKYKTYGGGSPWTFESSTGGQIPNVTAGQQQAAIDATEYWGMVYNDQNPNSGIGVYNASGGLPNVFFNFKQLEVYPQNGPGTEFTGGFTFFQPFIDFNNIVNNRGNYVKDITTYLIVGNENEIRSEVYRISGHENNIPSYILTN